MPEQKENDAGDAPAAGKRSFSQRLSPSHSDVHPADQEAAEPDSPTPAPSPISSVHEKPALVDPTDSGTGVQLRLHVIDCCGYVQPASLRIAWRNDHLGVFQYLSRCFIRDSDIESSYQLAFLARIPGTDYLDYVECDQTAQRFIDDMQNKPTAELWAFNVAYLSIQQAADAVDRPKNFVGREQAIRREQSTPYVRVNPLIWGLPASQRYSL